MASTYSTNLALELIGTGEQSGTWGTTTNTNLGTLLEQAISGYVTQAITDGSGANTTITIPNGTTGVARNMFIEMTGALSFSTTSLIVPANKKMYFVFNNTSGGFAVTVKVSGQTGILVPNGKKVILTCNGTDIVEAHTAIVGNATIGGTLGVTGTLSGGTSGTGYSFSGSAPATSLTLDSSGQLGIGEATPTQKVHAKTASTTYYLAETTGTSASAGFRMKAGASADYTLFTTQGVNQFAIYDNAAGSQRVTLDSSGNLGLGVTPSAWDASVYKALQISTNSSIASFTNGETRYSSNCFYNSSVWKYITSSQFASAYTQGAGAHTWYSAPSGTAGNAITFTQAMTLDASGNLGVGATSGFNALSGTETTVYIKNSGINVASLYLEGSRKLAIFSGGAGQLAFYDITGAKELGQFDSSGNLLVGQTSTGLRNSNSLSLEPSASGAAFVNHVNGSSSGNGYIFFGYNGSAIGSITQSGTTAVLYNTTSDYRLKTVTGVVKNGR